MKPEISPIPLGALPLATCPEAIWARVEAATQPSQWRWIVPFAIAASLVAGWFLTRSRVTWDATRVIAGVETHVRLSNGDRIDTGANEETRIAIGDIGEVRVQPNSHVRILSTSKTEHRLALTEGVIEAQVSAPPRLFFVDTPTVTAVDLGCAYRMESDAQGNGLLRVTTGWVALGKGREDVMVPAGASARIRHGLGAGTPFFDDAPEALRTALADFDQNAGGLETILSAARARDTLTLWHLLSRTQAAQREQVYERIAALVPIPAGIRREQALALDPDTLKRLREELAWKW